MENRRITPGFIGFISLAISIAVISYITSFGHFTNLAYLCGYGFGSAGLMYVFGIALLKKYPKTNVALVACLLAIPWTVKDQYQELRTSLDMRRFMSDLKSSDDMAKAINQSQTRMASALRVIINTNENTNNELIGIFSDYESEFYNDIVNINNLKSRQYILSMLTKLNADRDKLQGNINRIPIIFSKERDEIEKGLSFFSKEEQKFVKNIKDGNERTRSADMTFVTQRAKIALSVFDNIIDLLNFIEIRSDDIYQNTDGKIIFQSNSDAEQFNKLIAGIRDKSSSEEKLVENYNLSLVDRQAKMAKLMNFELP